MLRSDIRFFANNVVLSQNLFCRNLHCFVAKSVLLQFTRFCVEKNLTKNCACGEKKTNIKYGANRLLNTKIKSQAEHHRHEARRLDIAY